MPTFSITGRIIKKYENPDSEYGGIEIRNHNHIVGVDPGQMRLFKSKFISTANPIGSSLKEGLVYRFYFDPKVEIVRNRVNVEGGLTNTESLEIEEEISINDI